MVGGQKSDLVQPSNENYIVGLLSSDLYATVKVGHEEIH